MDQPLKQEWTVVKTRNARFCWIKDVATGKPVTAVYDIEFEGLFSAINTAHSAALAAAYTEAFIDVRSELESRIEALTQQLAAERSKVLQLESFGEQLADCQEKYNFKANLTQEIVELNKQLAAEREHRNLVDKVLDNRCLQLRKMEDQLAAERQRREQAEARPAPIAGNWIAHQSENPKYPEEWDVFEGGPRGYSVIGDGFITEDQAKEIASRHNLVEQQLLSALAEIEKKHSALYDLLKGRNKTSEANALKALDYTNLDALHEHDAKVREPLVEALEWAWAIIANAGGGDWQREAKDWQDAAAKWRDEAFHPALAKVKEQ